MNSRLGCTGASPLLDGPDSRASRGADADADADGRAGPHPDERTITACERSHDGFVTLGSCRGTVNEPTPGPTAAGGRRISPQTATGPANPWNGL